MPDTATLTSADIVAQALTHITDGIYHHITIHHVTTKGIRPLLKWCDEHGIPYGRDKITEPAHDLVVLSVGANPVAPVVTVFMAPGETA